jgi:uncharacterized UPF0160 family protein
MAPGAGEEPPAKRSKVEAASADVVTIEGLQELLRRTNVHAKIPESGLADGFICTHHGTFHADEAMACAMLKCLPSYRAMPILRTRNQAEIDKASIVVDVGGTYEPEKHRYDHHQKTFESTYSEDYAGIKLSSAGLVFKHFGAQVVEALCGKLEPAAMSAIVAKTYASLICELDALDNGVQIADEPRYRFVTHLGARIGRLNPSWQEPNSPEVENSRFQDATCLAAKELTDVITGYATSWLPARTIVETALSQRSDVHASKEIMRLPKFCPWQEHLFDLEEEAAKNGSGAGTGPLTKYVLFTDSRGGHRVQAVSKARGSFENRLSLPKEWCGLREEALSEAAGIPGCVFVHAAGFIGGANSEAGAFELASKALALAAAATKSPS